ncbi:MAG TPA: hypothetical protein VEG34_08025 [Thermoanaerobaculia bacterium]|nr:hypothetical protein [Thermoanaerobaculia bacterium]
MNRDDTGWRELTRAAREEQEAEESRLDQRWDRLSAGELTAEEEAELRALAAGSEEGRAAYEAFRPLGPDFQARVVQELRALQAGGAAAESAAAVADEEPRNRVLPFWRRRPARLGWLSSAAAAAAAMILLFNPLARPPALPLYGALETEGGIERMRGEPAPDTLLLAPGSSCKLTVRPDTDVQGKLAARGFLERGGELRRWDLPEPVITESGVVRIAGTVGREIDLGPGEWTLWLVVGRPGKLPDAEDLRPHLGRGPVQTRNWIARSASVRVRRESG